jgi:hypothetical protein
MSVAGGCTSQIKILFLSGRHSRPPMLIRYCLFIAFFAANPCFGQTGWQLEIMPGIAAYRGDLTQSAIPVKTIGPAFALNLKYDLGDMIVFRGGAAYGKISAYDKDNKKESVRARNLSFHTVIWEANLCAEVNILDPEAYYSYPYVFLGIGAFRFDPYAYDNNNQKTYLRQLHTEGQGLPQYPDKKMYSKTQLCVPFGGGWKVRLNKQYAISFELGVRFLFTDYLDDVSGTYPSETVLLTTVNPKSVEMSFRQTPHPGEGQVRGNPETKDMYVFSGVKLTYTLSKSKKDKEEKKERKEKKKKEKK